MKISEVTDYLESCFPLLYQEDYDNSGLIIGDSNEDAIGSLVALDCTEEVVEEAIKLNCNLIITHHPMTTAMVSMHKMPANGTRPWP